LFTELKVVPNPALLVDAYLLEERSWKISSKSDLKRRSLGIFEERCPNKNNKMSNDMGSAPDPKNIELTWIGR